MDDEIMIWIPNFLFLPNSRDRTGVEFLRFFPVVFGGFGFPENVKQNSRHAVTPSCGVAWDAASWHSGRFFP